MPNNPGRVGSDGKTYSSAGLPKDPNEPSPRAKADGAGRPARPRRRESDAPPWDDTSDPLPAVGGPRDRGLRLPGRPADAKQGRALRAGAPRPPRPSMRCST